ncbi:MAG: trans-sulfuration enzyme family protein, partial [Nitrospirales bacterium]
HLLLGILFALASLTLEAQLNVTPNNSGQQLADVITGNGVVVSNVTYAATAEIINDMLPRQGIKVTKVNSSDLSEVERAVKPTTKLVFIETPCNPILRMSNIPEIARIADRVGAELAVDSTLATPIATQPLKLGADYVIHSLTKYLCGHGDAIGGAIIGGRKKLEALRQQFAIRNGGVLSPFNAWLIMRGIATLPLRMHAHQEGAMKVACFLQDHKKVSQVGYPGLPSFPDFELARTQMKNFSGLLTFQLKNHRASTVERLCRNLRIFHYAVSLGHHRSLMFYLPTEQLQNSSFQLSKKALQGYRKYAGDGIFRVSVGLEDPEDLCEDLDHALSKI